MTDESIDFPSLIETALIGVVREVLRRAADEGLPGGHHFFLSFDTSHEGVELPDRLRREYPEEMTIVLENQFWDLEADDERFAVTLSFDRKRERLVVPFAALTAFVDPSVPFGLRFGEDADADDSTGLDLDALDDETPDDERGGDVVAFDPSRRRGD